MPPRQTTFSDEWRPFNIRCGGGLVLNADILTQSATMPGTALVLQNYEEALEGGYKRILGYSKFDANVVPGDANTPVQGVKVYAAGVVASRFSTTTSSNDVYFSGGAGWTKINSVVRGGVVAKMRGVNSSIISPSVIILDGINPAAKWDGLTWTTINGTGAPTDPKFGAVYYSRLVLAGYSSDPQEISISEPNSDIAFTAGGGAASIPCSDIIKGIRSFRGDLFIYCQNSIKKLTGTTTADFAIQDVTVSIGCLSNDTIQEIGGDIVFLAPDGFRSTAATSRIGDVELGLVSRQIQPLVRQELSKNNDENKYSSCGIRAKSQYRAFFNDSDTQESGQIGFLGVLQERSDPLGTLQYSWSTMRGIKPYCADSQYTNNQEYAVIGHPTNGFVYRLESGNSFDGASISAIYRSPDLFMDSDVLRKVAQKLTTYTELEGDATVTFKLYLDRGDPTIPQPMSQPFGQVGSLSTYGTGIYGTSKYGAVTVPTFTTNIVGSGKAFGFEYSSDDTNPPHRIDDFTVVYSLKGYR